MKMLLLLPIATASLLLAQDPTGPPQAGARRGPGGFPAHYARESRAEHISKVLGLTAAQQQKAHELFQEEAVNSQGLRQKMQGGQHESMRDAVKRGASSEEIDKIAQDRAAMQAEMSAMHAKTMAKLYATLTPEQQKIYDAHPELSMAAGPMHGPRGRGGPDGASAQRFKGRTPPPQQN